MSLVDYASSSDDEQIDDDEEEKKRDEPAAPPPSAPPPNPPRPPPLNPQSQNFVASSHQSSHGVSSLPPVERLPDASLLLASPSLSSHQAIGNDHASRVAAAMAESASRKRESNGSTFPYPRSKYPRGHLPHSRNVPDTVDGLLIPPQLSGRSNVVTEDINRLFVNRHSEASR